MLLVQRYYEYVGQCHLTLKEYVTDYITSNDTFGNIW